MQLEFLDSLSLFAAIDFYMLVNEGLRLVAALLAGAVIGWDRERHDKPAGLRTHMLVSLGSAMLMVIATRFATLAQAGDATVRVDPTRVIAGIVGGIGFIGAGAIMKGKGRPSVSGITTAASVWVSSAAGIACGMGYHDIAFVGVLLAGIVLIVIGRAEQNMPPPETGDGDGS